MDELVQTVARCAGITPEQSRLAIAAVLRALSHRLPSPVVGRIRAILDEPRNATAGADRAESPSARP